MCPSVTEIFSSQIRELFSGRGVQISKYESLVGKNFVDLLFFLPISIKLRIPINNLSDSFEGKLVTFAIKVQGINDPYLSISQKKPLKVLTNFIPINLVKHFSQLSHLDQEKFLNTEFKRETVQVLFFNGNLSFLKKTFQIGTFLLISGKLSKAQNAFTVVHPDIFGGFEIMPLLIKPEPVYQINQHTKMKTLRGLIHEAIQKTPILPEWINKTLKESRGWPSWRDAIFQAHNPKKHFDLTIENLAKQRLVFDELLAKHIMLSYNYTGTNVKSPKIEIESKLVNKLMSSLPFELTDSQKKVIKEIELDFKSMKPMVRLVQGDVGTGKTIIAFFTLLYAIDSRYQTAFLAPTDILANQHFNSALKFLENFGLKIELYTSQVKGRAREKILNNLLAGEIDILIGTHALIQEGVNFKNLGCVIIDEQHRFGVEQRMKLSEKVNDKGEIPHVLSLSATPIPRSLLLAQYSGVSVSIISEKPKNRQNIITKAIPIKRMDEVISGIKSIIEKDNQVYWICPLIEESDQIDVTATDQRFKHLKEIFGEKNLGLIHGKMKSDEKQEVMDNFQNAKIKILVATTVIEIGVDVKKASIIIIEHAERFGLAQLHQLRGRVGRGEKKSNCILLYDEPLNDIAKKRLSIIRNCDDGFKIAELDLILRGAGNIFGTQQSGATDLKFLKNFSMNLVGNEKNFDIFSELSAIASSEAIKICNEIRESGKTIFNLQDENPISNLLKIFSEDSCERDYRKAG